MRLDLHSISAGLALALGLAGCGRTEALVELGNDELADDDTFSFEETATSDDVADEAETSTESDTNETSTESGTDENEDFTTEWSDDVIDTWGTDDFDTFETFDTVDTFDTSTDIDTFDTFETFDTFDTFDTSTDVDTFDTSTDVDTFDTSTDVDSSTSDSSSNDTSPGPTCAEAAECLIDCGSFDNMCINQCTMDLGDAEAAALFDLQICAVQSCFFLGLCTLGDFNSPECVDCRFDVNSDPDNFGCAAEGMACGI